MPNIALSQPPAHRLCARANSTRLRGASSMHSVRRRVCVCVVQRMRERPNDGQSANTSGRSADQFQPPSPTLIFVSPIFDHLSPAHHRPAVSASSFSLSPSPFSLSRVRQPTARGRAHASQGVAHASRRRPRGHRALGRGQRRPPARVRVARAVRGRRCGRALQVRRRAQSSGAACLPIMAAQKWVEVNQ